MIGARDACLASNGTHGCGVVTGDHVDVNSLGKEVLDSLGSIRTQSLVDDHQRSRSHGPRAILGRRLADCARQKQDARAIRSDGIRARAQRIGVRQQHLRSADDPGTVISESR